MFCPHCGKKIRYNSPVCPHCGSQLDSPVEFYTLEPLKLSSPVPTSDHRPADRKRIYRMVGASAGIVIALVVIFSLLHTAGKSGGEKDDTSANACVETADISAKARSEDAGTSDSSDSAQAAASSAGTGQTSAKESTAEEAGTETTSDVENSASRWDEYDDLIQTIYKDSDTEDREAKMHDAEDMIMDTGAVIPIYYYNDLYLQNTSVTGDYSNLFGTKYFMYAQKDRADADILRIGLASPDPDSLDPALVSLDDTIDEATLASNSFVGLYTCSKDGSIQPALADGEPEVSDDGTQYVIHMKTGLKWSDGSTLNANDFVYSWKRAAEADTGADYSYLFNIFAKNEDGEIDVSATDENTISFTLTGPCPYMRSLLTFPIFMPVPQTSVQSNKSDPGAWASTAGFVSNGAYTLQTWNENDSLVYVKNPYFYDADNVSVNELDFRLIENDASILSAYQNGDIDYTGTVPNDQIGNVKDGDDFHVYPIPGTYYLCFNVNSSMFDGLSAEQAADVRKAIALLINRQYIIDTIGQTNQTPATSLIPPGVSDGHSGVFKANDAAYTYPDEASCGYYSPDVDTEKAIELLEEAGYVFTEDGKLSDETPITFSYLTNEGTGNEALASAIQEDLEAVGITVNITVQDWDTFTENRDSGNFDMVRKGWIEDYDDPIEMLEMFTTDSDNNICQLGR